jgi:hypothetical protein
MTEQPSIFGKMLAVRRAAFHAHCRVKIWHLTDSEAMELADACQTTMGRSVLEMYRDLKAGGVTALGARVVVR